MIAVVVITVTFIIFFIIIFITFFDVAVSCLCSDGTLTIIFRWDALSLGWVCAQVPLIHLPCDFGVCFSLCSIGCFTAPCSLECRRAQVCVCDGRRE